MHSGELIEEFPLLYHVTTPPNWQNILGQGLMSTSALLSLFGISEPERTRLESTTRPESVEIVHPTHGRAILRDNKPLTEARLKSCLGDGITPSEWLLMLNQRVFLWPTMARVEHLLSAAAYRSTAQLVLSFDTRKLVERHATAITLSPMNSGATRPFAHPRGRSTFLPIDDYDFEHWRKKRSRAKAIAEVTFSDVVLNVQETGLDAALYEQGTRTDTIWSTSL